MEKNLYIDASHPDETRVVLKSENRIEEYEYENRNKLYLKNNIYLGKVSRIEPSLQAAFVNYGKQRHGFLAFNDIQTDYYQIPHDDKARLKKDEEKLRLELKQKNNEAEEIEKTVSGDETNSSNEIKNEIQKQIKTMPGQEKMVMDYYQKNPSAVSSLRGALYEEKILDLIKNKITLNKKNITTKEAEDILKSHTHDLDHKSDKEKNVKKSKIKKKSKKK